MRDIRLIHDPPASGDWNMAVDEMMLESAASSGQGVLRFYSWNEPTLSLGYFQALEDRQAHLPSLSCPVVRRSTGGGAIVHDQELTYSVALPLVDRWSNDATALYDLFHGSLVTILGNLGLAASLQDNTQVSLQAKFLCFERRAKGDVIVGGRKIAGSAQRRKRGSILQHGSVLLAASSAAPEVPGLGDLGRLIASEELAVLWRSELERGWRGLAPGSWTNAEVGRAKEIQGTRFADSFWLHRRGMTDSQPG